MDAVPALRARLEAWSPDDAEAAFAFTARLARDNGWSEAFAARVVREYRRFIELYVTAGHPVTPSDEVDQAWHLHLLYTQDYWGSFCAEVTRVPIHHGPTRGGDAEQDKFVDWYARTLASYERIFGETPPADIWPPAHARFGRGRSFVRVSRADVWLVPKQRVRRGVRAALLGGFALTLLGGCAGMVLALDDQDQVVLFGLVGLIIVVLAGVLAAQQTRRKSARIRELELRLLDTEDEDERKKLKRRIRQLKRRMRYEDSGCGGCGGCGACGG